MSAGHTPGPWAWAENEHEANLYGIGVGGKWLAGVRHNGEDLPEKQRSNICLMTASPDLLKALTYLVANQDATWAAAGFTDDQIKAMPYLKPARAAISKATNQPS